jgi:hypothetical protein
MLLTGGTFALPGRAVFAATAPANQQSESDIEFQRLAGRWLRPDGGYVLELRDIKQDGNLKAAYFNPAPINVFRAKLERKDHVIKLFVELRDVNYPGSAYDLQYDPRTDRLKGTYFQAVEKRAYEIEFVRTK